MKRETRKWLEWHVFVYPAESSPRDALDSDARERAKLRKQSAEIRDLKAALRLSREQHDVCGHDDRCDYCREARERADAVLNAKRSKS